jgi:hypothetical protein
MEFEHLHGDERKPVLILSSLQGAFLSIGSNVQTAVSMTSVKLAHEYGFSRLSLTTSSPFQNSPPQDATSAPLQQFTHHSTI